MTSWNTVFASGRDDRGGASDVKKRDYSIAGNRARCYCFSCVYTKVLAPRFQVSTPDLRN